MQTWVTQLGREGSSPRSVAKIHGVLRQLLDWAVKDGRLARNPAVGVPLPRPALTAHRYLDHSEVAMLAKECGDYSRLVRFLAYTGLRWGEAAALRVGSVDLTRRRVAVVASVTEVNGHLVWGAPKTHARRTVPFRGSSPATSRRPSRTRTPTRSRSRRLGAECCGSGISGVASSTRPSRG
ncbi:tyrosine-type recombinase/integrase [Pseudonocardia sp.]|uniref:tyrosine-type recombinase/integrase n=1 Tax=Pseudonocardia sp. TaxID=60912 RepID=UPI003D147515